MRDRAVQVDRTDLVSALGGLGDRLRAQGYALSGMAAEEGGRGTPEARVKSELAADLRAMAGLLDLLRERLCPGCALAEVAHRVTVGAAASGAAARSPGSRRRRNPRTTEALPRQSGARRNRGRAR